MTAGLDPYRAAGARLSQTLQLSLIAEGHLANGDRERALAVLEEAAGQVVETEERFWEADLKRVEGEVRKADDPVAAERLMREAIDTATDQGSAGHHLRAAVSLARLLVDLGRKAEVDGVLRPAREGFRDGTGLPDIEAADRLLSD